MKASSLLSLVVLLALETPASWAVEGSDNEMVKQGTCPTRLPVECSQYEIPECLGDWQCPEKKKCCPDYCSIKCLDSVPLKKPEKWKPGKCPVIDIQCDTNEIPNGCVTDMECARDFKCCGGMCGKLCVRPLKA